MKKSRTLCADAVIASVPSSALVGLSADEVNNIGRKVASKVANATEIRHDVSFGIVFRCYEAGISDRFEMAALATTLGSVNPNRLGVSVRGDAISISFNPSGLSPVKAQREAAATFTKVAAIISHKLMMSYVSS